MRRGGARGRRLPAALRPGRGAGTVLDELAGRIAERIHRAGPIPFSEFAAAALDEFFAHGGAGRAGADFVTSPEVGPLFGALVAGALDRWWDELGRPDPFLVVEAGAGNGRLTREILRAEPTCAPALRCVLVERSPALRAGQRELLSVEPWEDALGPYAGAFDAGAEPEPVAGTGPIVTALDELPALAFDGVILANELLDNLPFDVVERHESGWWEIRVGLDGEQFVEVPVPAPRELALAFDAPVGARLPAHTGVERWIQACGAVLRRGFVCLVDYAAPAAELVERGQPRWLRTYREHARGASPLEAPGSQDITADIVLETLRRAARDAGFGVRVETTQAAWLGELGIDTLVEEGRARWRARAHVGDLEALASRSRVTEAAALTDPAGLGAHTVVVLTRGLRPRRQ